MHFASTIMTLAAQRKGIIHVRVATATTRRSGSPFTGQLLEARDSILEKRVGEGERRADRRGRQRRLFALFPTGYLVCVCVCYDSISRATATNKLEEKKNGKEKEAKEGWIGSENERIRWSDDWEDGQVLEGNVGGEATRGITNIFLEK